jgi:DNA-binding LacI/PurR family transcriptional regulator
MTRRSSSVTIRDVAKQAGVSIATVSRYINQTATVSPEIATRLDEVLETLKYVPHSTARNLATQKTNSIGLLLTHNIYGDYFSPLLRGIEEVVTEAGFNLLISSNSTTLSNEHSPALGPNNTDGILGFADSLTEEGLTHFYHSNFPIVLIHRSSPPQLSIPTVTVENKAASKEIVDHLIDVHHRRRIVFLRGPELHEDSHWREMGYRSSLEAHNIPYDPELVLPGEFEREVAQTTMIELILAGVEFDAVFGGNDDAAIGVLAALREMGKRVPEDVSVVGFDDIRSSPYLTPSLTTVRAPTEEVGRVAAQQLIKLIRGGQADPLTLLPTEMVFRKSCGCQTDQSGIERR